MKKIFLLLSASFLLMACPTETIDPSVYNKDYGDGLYILTENGVNFYDLSEDILKEDVFTTVNGSSLTNPSSINSYGNKIYLVTANTFYSVDPETFYSEFSVGGFINAQQSEYAKFNRFYVTDKGESEIKVVDVHLQDISSHIKTGESVNPTGIVVNSGRAFVINSGSDDITDYDSTLVAVELKDGVIPLNDFVGNVIIGKNPSSVFNDGNIVVLCKGIYDEINPANNEESSYHRILTGNLNVLSSSTLSNIYNADNLCANSSVSKFYFTTSDGVYQINTSGALNPSQVIPMVSDVLLTNVEQYNPTDTTTAYTNMLYLNDALNNPNMLYKYNLALSLFVDTIQLNADIIDLMIY
jgi:hypothetical protein